jgi:hypothetical protein
VGAVGLDHEVGDEVGRGFASTDAAELGLDHLRAFDHFFFRFKENVIEGHAKKIKGLRVKGKREKREEAGPWNVRRRVAYKPCLSAFAQNSVLLLTAAIPVATTRQIP